MDESNLAQQAPSTTMQLAESQHRQAMIASFCEAFADDPGLAWVWPDRDERIGCLPHFFEGVVGGTMAYGIALHSFQSDAVSLWRRPGEIHPGPEEMQMGMKSMAMAVGSAGERLKLMGEATKAHQPIDHAWWYLQFIGVRPTAQGTGLGWAAARAGIDLAREDGNPVWVEVMNPDNLGFYLHLGFKTVIEYDLPKAGPHVWGMTCQP